MKKHWVSGLRTACLTVPLALALGSPAIAQRNQIFDSRTLAPFVPTPQVVVTHMLELAAVGPDDVVYDLGSGDGRILIMAAQDYKARAVGVEISKPLVEDTIQRVQALGIDDKVTVIHQNMLDADLSGASVVTVYLMTSSNEQLKPKLERELEPGARVVSHDFQFEGWRADSTVEIDGGARTHTLYLYRMGSHRGEAAEQAP